MRALVAHFIVILVFLAPLATFGQAAVSGTPATSKTAYTAGTGKSRIILVIVAAEGNNNVTNVTYGGVALTQFGEQPNVLGMSVESWYMTEATLSTVRGACSFNFVVTWAGAPTNEIFSATTIANVNQTTPIQGFQGGFNPSGTTVAPITPLAVTAGQLALYVSLSSEARTHTAAAGYTERTDQSVGASISMATTDKPIVANGTESPTATWSGAAQPLLIAVLGINSVTAVGVQTFYSLATGAWDSNTTWSLSADGSSGALAAGVWPTRTDNVVIRSTHIVTIDALDDNKTCGVSASSLGFANVGQGGGGGFEAFDNSATTAFYQIGNITVRGTLQETGGSNNIMTLGTTTVVTGGTFTTNQNYYNLGFFEVQSGSTFAPIGNFIITGNSTSLINSPVTIGNDFGIDWTNATLCGSGTATLTLGAGSSVTYTNGATVAQICTSFTFNCSGGGCTGFPVTGTTPLIVGNAGPAGVGNAANNKLWLRSTDISQANNTAVATWADASGNGLSATQGTAGNRPVFFTNVTNTVIPAVRFTGGSLHYLTLGQPASLNFVPQTNPYSYVAAVNVPTGNTGTTICRATSANRQWQFTVDGTNPNRFGYFRGGTLTTGDQVATNAWKIPVANVPAAATGFNAFVNGTTDTQANTNIGTATAAATDVLVGARRNADNTDAAFALSGDIGEIALYNTTLAQIHRTLIENYLASKFDVTITTDLYDRDAPGLNYDFDVAGIGMVGGLQHSDARGSGIVRIWNPSSLADGDYLLFGHDVTPLVDVSGNVDGTVIRERLTRIWAVDKTNDVGTVNISFDLSAFTGPFVGSNLRLLIDRDGNFTTNDVTPIVGSFSSGIITFTGVSFLDNDRFTLGNTALTSLPIELLTFKATPEQDAVRLNWSTLSEHNNDFFTVERSSDGEAWLDIDFVKGAGNSSGKHQYSAADNSPLNGLSYYRLRQTDFDGSFKYSNVERIELSGIVRLNVFPNPSSSSYTITASDDLTSAEVRVLDVLGRPVTSTITRNVDSISVDPNGATAGIYFIHISTEFWNRTVRVVRE